MHISSGSSGGESLQDEDKGYFFDDDDDNQDVPLVISSFPADPSPPQRERNPKKRPSCSFKGYLGVALLMIGGILVAHFYNHSIHHQHSNKEATGSSWRPNDSEDEEVEPTDSVDEEVEAAVSPCEEQFLNGITWISWLQVQGSLPAQGKCHNPLTPWDKTVEMRRWKQTFERNKNLVRKSISDDSRPLDVVFFGDSITEHWLGTDLGSPIGRYKEIIPVYEAFFRNESAPLHGLALGIGGDRCGNLLYRIIAGEMPDELQPKIFWLLIGTNDFGGDKCSEDAITAGNLGIAQAILKAKPNARIVLNSILPRGRRKLDTDRFPHIRAINQHLECFANANDRVHFFNATDYFTTADGQFLNMTLMSDYVHPGGLGSEIWAQGITDFALDLIKTYG